MQSEMEIRKTIAGLRAAMDADGFKPIPDGTHLKEPLYYLRLGAIQHLEDVVMTQDEIDEAEENNSPCEDPLQIYPGAGRSMSDF